MWETESHPLRVAFGVALSECLCKNIPLLARVFLDFWQICGYTSNNLRYVVGCSTRWKRKRNFMLVLQRVLRSVRWGRYPFLYPVGGPGAALPEMILSSPH